VGCKEVTPHLVSLARRLEDQPFHLIATHRQNNATRSEVIAYLKANGLSVFTPNFSVTKMGSHPDIPGNGFAPYYAVFDHTGTLVHDHMGGSYHGGDGLEMIRYVDQLLAQTPAIYLGAAPFKKIGPLAHKVSSGKALGASVKRIDSVLAAPPDAATAGELKRLLALVVRYRDRKLQRALGLVGSEPDAVLGRLKQLARSFQGTSLAADVESELAVMQTSGDLKAAVGMQKKFRRIVKAFERVKEKKRSDALIEKTVQKLEALLVGHESLPFASTVEAYLADLR